MSSVEIRLAQFASRFEADLDETLAAAAAAGPGIAPDRLLAAMRYGALGGGKRLRPFLLAETAAVFGIPEREASAAGIAVELVHCYSLIHDDLPAMDDDDLRRGRPTVHKAFDEAAAILAGDALMTHAFGVLAGQAAHPDPALRIRLITELVEGAGVCGMAGGQMRDLEGERGGFSDADIAMMQKMKTGTLIRAAVRMGAILGNADTEHFDALTGFGDAAGRAFQLADDILDLVATSEQMGKATGKDHARNKPTLVACIGLKAAERHLGDTIHDAISALHIFGPEATGLREIARYFAERES